MRGGSPSAFSPFPPPMCSGGALSFSCSIPISPIIRALALMFWVDTCARLSGEFHSREYLVSSLPKCPGQLKGSTGGHSSSPPLNVVFLCDPTEVARHLLLLSVGVFAVNARHLYSPNRLSISPVHVGRGSQSLWQAPPHGRKPE